MANEPWLTKEYNEGERVEVYEFPIYHWPERLSTSKPISEGVVVGTQKNRYGRISYLLELPNGDRQIHQYEWLRLPQSEAEKKKKFIQSMNDIYSRLIAIAPHLSEEQQVEVLSRLEQLCKEFKQQ